MSQETDVFAHRRGLMLGLTLSEMLMLVLFILLLTYTAILAAREQALKEAQARTAALELTSANLQAQVDLALPKLAAAVSPPGLPVPDLKALELRLREITADIARTEAANQKLSRLVPSPDEAERIAEALEATPNAPPAELILKEWLAENTLDPKQGEGAPAKPETLEDAVKQIARLEGQLDYVERQVEEAGNGLTLPPCWSRNDRIVYIYNVGLLDDAVIVRAGDDRTGMDLAGLRANGPELPYNQPLSMSAFLAGTKGLFDWSVDARCRFYVRIFDETGSSNKQGYRRARRTVEGHFYIREAN